jgi:hypothetical protein
MLHCIECGEDVPAYECYYDDFGGVMIHAMGVTGVAEPHELGEAS